VKDKWFVNLPRLNIPQHVQSLLQLRQNFSLSAVNTKNNITQFIKNLKNNIIKLDTDIQTEVRNRSIPVLHNLLSKTVYNQPIDKKIIILLESTKKFLKNNPNILFTRIRIADKGYGCSR